MFDLVTGRAQHIPNHNAVPLLMSSIAEAAVLAVVIAVPLLFIAEQVPEVPSMLAFVAAAPPPAPPPPPAPAVRSAARTPQRTVATTGPSIPIEAPAEIRPEPPGLPIDEGVPGGVEGGIPGGIVGGVVGGVIEAPPPPPPPPPPPSPPRPVRIGGDIQPPTLITRIEPEYPPLAVASRITGVVILEATVNVDGQVTEVRVLRSVHRLLDAEAMKAVKQWRYSPLTLNGHRTPFVLTVTLSFSLKETRS
jgi:protein TonB